MLARLRTTGAVAALLAACAADKESKRESAAGVAPACRTSLPPRDAAPPRLPPAAPKAPAGVSRLVTHAELELGRLKRELEAKIPSRLAEAEGVGIGVAGRVNYTADRAPFRLTVEQGALIVETDVNARAQACKGSRCYASCEPSAIVRASVPLNLDTDYRFGPSRVTTTFTRGCKVRALGGFLTIDVTPTIEAQLGPELRKVEREIDRRLPKLRPQAEKLWAELSEPQPLPLGGCVVVQPKGIVQGPVDGSGESLRLRFGLLAEPEIRTRCGDVPRRTPLPPLAQDPALRAEETVRLGLVTPLTGVASALRAEQSVASAAVTSAGSAVDADLSLRGEVCGELALRAALAWDEDGRSLKLTSAELSGEERRRLEAASLEPTSLARGLTSDARIALPLDPRALDEVVPLLASSHSDERLEVNARISSVKTAEAAARGDDLVAWVRVKGNLTLREK